MAYMVSMEYTVFIFVWVERFPRAFSSNSEKNQNSALDIF